ncbi:MAG: DUF481 domain-containing protein [Pantoea sp.]|uniref:DUF481 domain-containing protein n=1 Tax=Pantoea sp. TaxID=69393 RepID=UPI0039E281E6
MFITLKSPYGLLLMPCLLTPFHTYADTVWLTNGDRLTGSLVTLSKGKLKIKTDYAGEISLEWKSVSTLLSEKEILLQNEQTGEKHTIHIYPSTPGYVHVVAPEYDEKVSVSRIAAFMQAKTRSDQWDITGNIDAGINLIRSNTDSENYDLTLNTKARKGKWRHVTDASFLRHKEESEVDTDNYSLRHAVDYMFHEQYFWQVRASYKLDWIADLTRQILIGTGPGYQLWDNEFGAFSLSVLGGGFRYNYRDGETDTHTAATLRWDYERYLNDNDFTLYSTGELGHSLGGHAIYSLDSEIGLRYTLTSWSSLKMSYHHNIVSGTRETLNENIFDTGVGIKW